MLTPTYNEGELRLLEAADLVENSSTYEQTHWYSTLSSHPFCSTPACVLGHYAAAHPEHWGQRETFADGLCPFLWEYPYLYSYEAAAHYFGLTDHEALLIFCGSGCGGADNGKSAAAYIRNFVYERALKRIGT